ncbi:MAG: HIT domain-containing protein [Spirochaetales bacterium]|nr:HIT domain-containing protein [Spirochaetales bacterium]
MKYVQERKSEPRETRCLLCAVLAGEPGIVDLTVYRDELYAVTVNLYPYNPGHLFLFPVRHVEDVRALTADEAVRQDRLVKYFLDRLDAVYRPSGYNIGYNMGRPAGASLTHLHQHLIPRYSDEIGLADLVAGKRVLVENPRHTLERLKAAVYEWPFSISMT